MVNGGELSHRHKPERWFDEGVFLFEECSICGATRGDRSGESGYLVKDFGRGWILDGKKQAACPGPQK